MNRALGPLLALCLVGCGDREERPPPTPAPPAAPAPEATPEPTPELSPEPTPESTRPSRDDRARVARLLARGREAAHSGRHAEALTLFRQGLEIRPDHQPLLCEAGWAAFHARDPDAADLIRRGADVGGEPRRRAGCLYNLGRYHEREATEGPSEDREQHRRAAIQAYRDSLELRPDNATTRAHLDALSDDDAGAVITCPPGDRFATVEALCAALLPINYERDASGREVCGTEPSTFSRRALSVDGEGPGELAIVADEATFSGNWTTWYLTLRSEGGLHALAELGHDWDRSCSSGGTTIESARWSANDDGPPTLEVVVHLTGEYSCGSSPWDTCMERVESEGGDTQACDGESDDNVELTDERRRLFCLSREGRYRCSVLGEVHSPVAAHATPGPLPERTALEAALVCPAD